MTLTELHRQKLIEIGKIVDEFYFIKQLRILTISNIDPEARTTIMKIKQILDADELKSNEEDFLLEKSRAESE